MTYRGHVKNGQIQLEMAAVLPEGAEVNVQVIEAPLSLTPAAKTAGPRKFEPIELPGGSLADELVRDRR